MSDLFETVKGDQDIVKKLLSYVPGFKGYIERSNRRSADKLLRDQVALKYTELAGRASRLQKDLADAAQIDFLDDIDSVSLKLRTFSDRIKNASYGYSGFFDAVKINEAELTQIYMIRSIGFGGSPLLIRNITFIRIRCCLINFRDLRFFVQIFIHSGGDQDIGGDQSDDGRLAGPDEKIYGPADADVTIQEDRGKTEPVLFFNQPTPVIEC